MLQSTAILVFSRTAEEEVQFKKLSKNHQDNIAICKNLYEQTHKAAVSSNLPVLDCSKQQQSGNNFAENITEAITFGFSKGFEHLIVIGTDCPGLTKSHIKNAYTALHAGNDIVAGQDMRGGIYLLGIRKTAFEGTSFLGFSWQTNKLYTEIKNYSSQYNFAKLNPVLLDINSKKDISTSLTLYNFSLAWRKLLLQLVHLVEMTELQTTAFAEQTKSLAIQVLRGPPEVCKY